MAIKTDPESLKKPLYVKLEGPLKLRLIQQCVRLNISQASATKQSLIKWLEEEEKIQANAMKR